MIYTKKDMLENAKFTERQIAGFTASTSFTVAYQLRINRAAILEKWKRKPIEYPTSPEEFGNEKYRQIVLYHGFRANLREKLKEYLGSDRRIDLQMVYHRKFFNIGSQKKGAKIPRHVTPDSFPEMAYWPKPTLFPPAGQSTPAPPVPPKTPIPAAGTGEAPLPRSKEDLREQGGGGDSDVLPDICHRK